MNQIWLFSLLSVSVVSLISLIGIFTLRVASHRLKSFLIYMLAFSAGALLGDVFFHIFPELGENGFKISFSISVLSGIVLFFIIEKFIHWQHCHMPIGKGHVHSFASMNLVGDALHNFIDGLIIASSYIVSIPIGFATTLAVVLHEIPQEIGDFGVLLHGGFSKKRAIFLNFITALAAVLGTILGLLFVNSNGTLSKILLGLAAGGFVYIASADLIPELHKETEIRVSLLQLLAFVIGIGIMALLLLVE